MYAIIATAAALHGKSKWPLVRKGEASLKVLVIPDVHLKPWMFDRTAEFMKSGEAEQAVCLMDIPDDWGNEYQLDLYEDTFNAAIRFQNKYPDTLWCYGNHDLSYEWGQYESGFSTLAIPVVKMKLNELRAAMRNRSQMKYIHRIDNVLFLHGGITRAFVKYYAPDADYDDTDAIVEKINSLGIVEMWDDASPIWFRPQFYNEKMYKENELLQVVGHTPVKEIDRIGNVLSCDVFSTYRTGDPIGTEELLLIDTMTWDYKGVK